MTPTSGSVDAALTEHDAFTEESDGFALETTVFDTVVTNSDRDGSSGVDICVTITLPTLDATTVDVVAPVVEDEWFETFDRRVSAVYSVVDGLDNEDLLVDRDDQSIRVVLEYTARDARTGVDDAKTMIEFVEGTYAEGLIPGYEYRGPAAAILDTARSRGEIATSTHDDNG